MLSLIIISGRSGSGKSTALHVLEDMGYYCIDNLPVSLLPPLIERLSLDQQTDRVSVSIDARNLPRDLEQVEQLLRQIPDTVQSQIIFLDSASPTLVKRYSETRRKHPLSNEQRGLREALDYESELLAPLAEMAALNLDTTQLNIHQLRDEIRGRVATNQQGFALLFVSFAFKHGVPVDADFVFDVRCLPNPHWKQELRILTGLDEPVQNFLDAEAEFTQMYDEISSFLDTWLPRFEANNRSYMTVAVGCTGGQHRSVYLSEKLYQRFQNNWENVQIRHREINRNT